MSLPDLSITSGTAKNDRKNKKIDTIFFENQKINDYFKLSAEISLKTKETNGKTKEKMGKTSRCPGSTQGAPLGLLRNPYSFPRFSFVFLGFQPIFQAVSAYYPDNTGYRFSLSFAKENVLSFGLWAKDVTFSPFCRPRCVGSTPGDVKNAPN